MYCIRKAKTILFPILMILSVTTPQNDNLSLNFDNPSREWLEFVIGNRRGSISHNYDITQGPVANDTLYRIISIYESGVLTFEETIQRLKVHELYDQLSFHSEKALERKIYEMERDISRNADRDLTICPEQKEKPNLLKSNYRS